MSASHSEFMRAANEQRLATFRKNSRIIKGVRWLGTLDAHCCAICGALDGATWDLDGNPLSDHGFLFHTPPLHPDCRCVLSPVPKRTALEDAFPGISAKIDAASRRASCDGPVDGSTTFQKFLDLQSPDFVERVLGKERAQLFLLGKVALRDLITPDCRERTLAELDARTHPLPLPGSEGR